MKIKKYRRFKDDSHNILYSQITFPLRYCSCRFILTRTYLYKLYGIRWTAPFNAAVEHLASIPHEIMLPLEICFILVPFLFHGLYGLYILMQAKNNVKSYGYARNWNFYFQRITAVIIFLFLIWHVVYLRIMVKGGGTPISFELLQAYFQNPIVWGAYTIAMIASIFHFFNGLTTFTMTWGIAKGPRIQTFFSRVFMAIFVVLSLLTIAFMSMYWF